MIQTEFCKVLSFLFFTRLAMVWKDPSWGLIFTHHQAWISRLESSVWPILWKDVGAIGLGFPLMWRMTHICQTQQSSFDIGIFVFWCWFFLRIPKWIHFSEYKVRRVQSMILRENERRERERRRNWRVWRSHFHPCNRSSWSMVHLNRNLVSWFITCTSSLWR